MGYDQDHNRPSKRPRDSGEGSHLPNLNINAGLAMENMGMGMGMGMSSTGDSLKNTRDGRQQQQQQQQQQQHQVSTSPTTSTGNRGRTDDKNNRKLSCKECRRRVLFPDALEFQFWYRVCCFNRLKLKASAILLLKPFLLKSYLNKKTLVFILILPVWSCVPLPSEDFFGSYIENQISTRMFCFISRVSKEDAELSAQKVRSFFYN